MLTRLFNLAVIVESLLVCLTTILLAQPKVLFSERSPRLKSFVFWVGIFFLFVTFVWSVFVGIISSGFQFKI